MKPLIARLKLDLAYLIGWLVYFALARIIFIGYNFNMTEGLTANDLLLSMMHGLRIDLSFSGYLCIIPFLVVAVSSLFKYERISSTLKIYTFIILAILNILLIVDFGLYEHWNIKIDSTAFQYIDTPGAMFASMSNMMIVITFFTYLALTVGFYYFFRWIINRYSSFENGRSLISFIPLLVAAGLLVLAMRGGLQTMPINQSNVYFSDKMFANHAAVNFAWNFAHSTSKTYDKDNPFLLLPLDESQKVMKDAFHNANVDVKDTLHLLNTNKPNIIIIVWESLTAKIIEPLGGVKDVTASFNKLTKEGILFTNFYSNGERSDKGMTSILSGYYPQPNKSIIKLPGKSRHLASLPSELEQLGYSTAYYYGGDLNFGNMKTYLVASGVDELVDGDSFSKADWNSKWGVHDDIMFKRFFNDIDAEDKSPFFKMMFTLSSHEPYEFPGEKKFGMETKEDRFMSSHAYTDVAFGDFITKAKQQDWWDETLIIAVADHGYPLPIQDGDYNNQSRFHIPMLWLGGALSKTGIEIDTYGSQSDISFNLMRLLGGDQDAFYWGKDLFHKGEKDFAHYIYNLGFGTVDDSGVALYDFITRDTVHIKKPQNQRLLHLGKSITQEVYEDFLAK